MSKKIVEFEKVISTSRGLNNALNFSEIKFEMNF